MYLILQVGIGLVLYDAMFYVFHIFLHTPNMYHKIHSVHHNQAKMSVMETIRLHPVEKFVLVIIGDVSMKIVNGHPLSRNIFTIVLVFLLFWNHSGLPITTPIIPFIMYSPYDHEIHHMKSSYYALQPFFCYFDTLFHNKT